MVEQTRESKKLSRNFGWLAFLGILLVVGGVVGLLYTGLATLTSMVLFGWLLLVGGLVGLLQSVQSRGTNFFWLGVVVAALNIAAGVVVIRNPVVTAEALTMFAALLFLTGGLFRVVGSVVVRGPQFGWTLVQGAFGLLLGLLVLFDWPSSSLYVLGTFFSLALLFDGLGLISIGVGGRRVVTMVSEAMQPDAQEPAPPPPAEAPETPAAGAVPRRPSGRPDSTTPTPTTPEDQKRSPN
jgi:uncharacterized membrane protein HdeD (DUF308 family)